MFGKQIWLTGLLSATMLLAACTAAPAPAAPAEPAAPAAEATTAPAAEAAPAADEACAPATEGELAGVDPSGQTVVWWHNHSGSREELLKTMVERVQQHQRVWHHGRRPEPGRL